MRKLKFYLLGLIPGLLFVFFILNKKGASCSGYLPSNRVVAETLSKEFSYTKEFEAQIEALELDQSVVKDSIIAKGKINFDRSEAQKKPCPSYLLLSPENEPTYEVIFEKCADGVTLQSIHKIK